MERYSLITAVEKKGVAAASPDKKDMVAFVAKSLEVVLTSLDDSKAEDIIPIDLRGRSPLGDHMVIASGRSQRHVNAVAEHLITALKGIGIRDAKVEGLEGADWVLIDTGDIIIHIFNPETREFYNLEKIWVTPETDLRKDKGAVH